MGTSIKGQYVPAEHIDAIRGRVEALAAQINEVLAELESFDLIDISFRKGSAPASQTATEPEPETASAAQKPTKPTKRVRNKAPTPDAEAMAEARKSLEDAVSAAGRPDKTIQRPQDETPIPEAQAVSEARKRMEEAASFMKPKSIEPRTGKRPFAKRERFGKLKQHLEVEHGKEIAEHMVKMCGDQKVTLQLRRMRELFIGAYPSKKAAADAYGIMVNLPHADALDAETKLAAVTEKLFLPDGSVALWGNEGDRDKLRRYREQESEADESQAAASA